MFPQGVYMTPFFMTPMSFIIFIQSILLLVPGSSPQMPRFEIPSNSYGSSGHMGQVSRPRVLAGDKCPGPSDIPWCQCRHDNSGISLTCHNIDQVVDLLLESFPLLQILLLRRNCIISLLDNCQVVYQ